MPHPWLRAYWKTRRWQARLARTNVIGALLATCLLTVTINADVFLVWLAQDWLSKLPLNSIIVMANASFHKPADSQQRIEQARHPVALLPPYSPDLNPIEHKWAQSKALQRQKACSIEELFALTF